MFHTLISLYRGGFPGRKGRGLAKIVIIYAILALKNVKSRSEDIHSEGEVASEIWSNFQSWLRFQIKYVGPRDWARTPLIRSVSVVHTDSVGKIYEDRIGKEHSLLLLALAKKLESTFNGLDFTLWRNYLARVYLHLNSFADIDSSPMKGELNVVEIGPGFGASTAILSLSGKKVFSIDLPEMHIIARYVEQSIDMRKEPVSYTSIRDININLPTYLKGVNYCILAFFSFTEINLKEREEYFNLIKNSSFIMIASNPWFEGVDNFEYIESLAKRLGKKCTYKPISTIEGKSKLSYKDRHRIYLLN